MYGPKQRYHDPFVGKTIPKYYQCSHTHVSGRRCKQMVTTAKTSCKACFPVQGDYCRQCMEMAEAFGIKL